MSLTSAAIDTRGRKFFVVVIELGFILISGVLKHFLPGMPAEVMIGASVTVVMGYMGINYVQKKAELNGVQKDTK